MAVTKAAVIGIDMGNMDSIAAYVGKGVVDIVQNEVSQRKTATLVAFNDQQRLLGDQALAQIKSNFKNTCRNFRHLLGRGMSAPDVEREKFWSPSELAECEDLQHIGYKVKYLGQEKIFSTTQIAAMFLTKIKEVTETWCDARLSDCVISVPSYYTDSHRQAVLDAAKIANLHVLRLINEHTATALAYGIYRSNDFDAETPTIVAFASMGHTTFSLAIVQFIKGELKVLSEASDRFCGGRDMDEVLIRHFAAEFEAKYKVDPLASKKGIIKMEDAVGKTKKMLSSNAESNIGVECLVDDYDLSGRVTREEFETMCAPLMVRVEAVIDKAVSQSGLPVETIQFVEIVGGASRVPWVQAILTRKFGEKELSKTVNADESVARGAALQAAILSPLYKVRDFAVSDTSEHSVSIGWIATSDTETEGATEDDKEPEAMCDGKQKSAVVFPVGSQFNTLKVLTFYRKAAFDVYAKYTDAEKLIEGTNPELGTYRIELAPQTDVKKIKVRAKLTIHGTFEIESAHMVEEEEYEEITHQRKEIPETEDEPMPQATDENATNGDEEKKGGEEKKEEKKKEKKEKKYETVEVKTMKKRTKKTDVPVHPAGVAKLSEHQLQLRKDEETALASQTRAVREKEERRNDVESYIYNMRDKINGVLAPFVKPEEKAVFGPALTAAEDWLYDQYDSDIVVYTDKLIELKAYGDPIKYRQQEKESRAEWVPHLQQTIQNYRMAAQSPSEDYAHIAAEKKQQIVSDCNATEAWLQGLVSQQAKLADYDDVVLKSIEIQEKDSALRASADVILSEPKPKPEPKAEEKPAENGDKPAEADKSADAPKDKPTDMDVDSTN